MPKKAPEKPKPLSFATPNPWSALPREVHVGTGHGKKEGATTESPVDGQDQPKIYIIRDHTLARVACRESRPYTAWRRAAVALESASTVRTRGEGGGCVSGYGCPGVTGPERVVQGATPAAQPETGSPEGRQRRDYGWGHP